MTRNKTSTDQLQLDFTSQLDECLALLRGLIEPITALTAWSPQKVEGVVELLVRICLCSTDRATSNARVGSLGSGVEGRRSVGEKTIRNWKADAKSLGLLTCVERSHHWGGHHTNQWQIEWEAVKRLVLNREETGRKWGGNDYRPGAVTATALTRVRSFKLEKKGGESPWEKIIQDLHQSGLKAAEKVARDCQQQGLKPADVATVLEEFQANRERCGRGPGAIVFRLREGIWPSEGRPLAARKPKTVIAEGLEIP